MCCLIISPRHPPGLLFLRGERISVVQDFLHNVFRQVPFPFPRVPETSSCSRDWSPGSLTPTWGNMSATWTQTSSPSPYSKVITDVSVMNERHVLCWNLCLLGSWLAQLSEHCIYNTRHIIFYIGLFEECNDDTHHALHVTSKMVHKPKAYTYMSYFIPEIIRKAQ